MMRSSQSFFNRSVLWRDMVRFFPVWGLFALSLVLLSVSVFPGDPASPYGYHNITGGTLYYPWDNVARSVAYSMNFTLLLYAPLCVFMLFGDLYDACRCNTLHSMPMRREGWFFTHATAGLLFFAVPYLALQWILWLIGGATRMFLVCTAIGFLEFLLYYGIALLCSQLCGNRIGGVLLYALLNFLAPVLQWITDTLYQPLMYGVPLYSEIFTPWSPGLHLETVICELFLDLGADMGGKTQQWTYLLICAGVGLVMGIAALLLYRKRPLETAGDLVSFRFLRPAFTVIFALLTAVALYSFLGHSTRELLFLILYLFVGFFAGRMLVEKRVRVFQGKAFLGYGVLILTLFGSLLLCRMDVFGIVCRIPELSQVKSITCHTENYDYTSDYTLQGFAEGKPVTEQEYIRNMILTQTRLLEERPKQMDHAQTLYLTYELQDGSTLCRYYPITLDKEEAVVDVISSFEGVFGVTYEEFTQRFVSLRATKGDADEEWVFVGKTAAPNQKYVHVAATKLINTLHIAMQKDCRQGTFAQVPDLYHYAEELGYSLEITLSNPDGSTEQRTVKLWTYNYTYYVLLLMESVGQEKPNYVIDDNNVTAQDISQVAIQLSR